MTPLTQDLADCKLELTCTPTETSQSCQVPLAPTAVFVPSPLVVAPIISSVPPLLHQAHGDKPAMRTSQLECELFELRLTQGNYSILQRDSIIPTVPALCPPPVACFLNTVQSPVRPLDAAKCTQDILKQCTCGRNHFKAKNCRLLLHTRHEPRRNPATSVTRTSTVPCPIGPKLRSVHVSHLVYQTNPQCCELVQRNIVSKLSFAASPYDRSMPRVAPVSHLIPLPRRKDDRSHRSYRSSYNVCETDHKKAWQWPDFSCPAPTRNLVS